MAKSCENNKKTLSEWLWWSAQEMKKAAKQTHDPTLKIKYEQIAGISREYHDKLEASNEEKEDSEINREIDILKAAYFCTQSVFWRFNMWPLEKDNTLVDEIVDTQKTIVRQLYSEIEKREKTR